MSVAFAVLLILTAIPNLLTPGAARGVADVLMAALLVVFAIRLTKTHKFMPAGMMLIVTLASAGLAARLAFLLVPDPSLPIWEIHSQIIESLRSGNRLILSAPTGSGKTTQVPQMLLESGLLEHGQVVILQPRRLAARLLAARVADELGVQARPGGWLSNPFRERDLPEYAHPVRHRRRSAQAND